MSMFSVLLRGRRAHLLAPFVLAAGLLLGMAVTESAAQPTAGGVSSSFRVSGRIDHPKTYRLADLKALPVHTVTVSLQGPGGTQTHSFTGALLYDVATAAAPRVDADQKNDILRWTARVHATDNYEVVVAWGEFDPGFEAEQVLLAYADNGQALTDTGLARLVVPNDKKGGRYVSNVNQVAFNPPRLGSNFPFFGDD
jgi:DMSO/TMAO reductase YedYZ molybdopterin-dependent catalytic subunit